MTKAAQTAEATGTAIALSQPQKAAAILVALGKGTAGRLLKFFKQEELRALMDGARSLRTIPQVELEQIVAEFEAEFAEGAGLLDSADAMDMILNETLTPEEMTALMNDEPLAVMSEEKEPVWPRLEEVDAGRVAAFLAGEHAQVAAFALTNLSPAYAAKVLLDFAKPARGEIVKRMMATGSVPADMAALLEDRLRAELIEDEGAKASSGGQMRVVNVLNELDKDQLDEVMDDLQSAGAVNLDAIRAQLFSFEDIELLDHKQRVVLFDGIAADMVTDALRGAGAGLTEAVLSALGARSRRMIEAELKSDAGNVTGADIKAARKEIASTAIRLASQGMIQLPQSLEAA